MKTLNSQCMISFMAKAERGTYADGQPYHWVPIPKEIKRSHCNMHGFRLSRRFGCVANSQIFPIALKRAVAHLGSSIDLTKPLPEGVSVDSSKFLTQVTIILPESQ